MKFYKYEGIGNDFIIIEGDKHINVVKMCDRHYGIGADGVICINENGKDKISIKIYNADGSEASTCGNGLRCVAAYLKNKYQRNSFIVETISDEYHIKCLENDMYEVRFRYPVSIEKEDNYYIVNSGNLHVLTIEDVEFSLFVNEIKKKYDANFETVKVIDRNNVMVRVYERGVGETLACGSASIAIVSALSKDKILDKEVNCINTGGIIKIKVDKEYVYLIAKANLVYKGEYNA